MTKQPPHAPNAGVLPGWMALRVQVQLQPGVTLRLQGIILETMQASAVPAVVWWTCGLVGGQWEPFKLRR